jgi:hypothetical protein
MEKLSFDQRITNLNERLNNLKIKQNNLTTNLQENDCVWGYINLKSKYSDSCKLHIEKKKDGICTNFLIGHVFESFFKIAQCLTDEELMKYNYKGTNELIQLAISYRLDGTLKPAIHDQLLIDEFYKLHNMILKTEKMISIYKTKV